jgi:hypothetical protein
VNRYKRYKRYSPVTKGRTCHGRRGKRAILLRQRKRWLPLESAFDADLRQPAIRHPAATFTIPIQHLPNVLRLIGVGNKKATSRLASQEVVIDSDQNQRAPNRAEPGSEGLKTMSAAQLNLATLDDDFERALVDLNSAELAEAARRCRLKSQAWLRNANLIEAWSKEVNGLAN